MGPGGIAAIVIAVIAVALITVFIVIKLYGKKFRRPGADGKSLSEVKHVLLTDSIIKRVARNKKKKKNAHQGKIWKNSP